MTGIRLDGRVAIVTGAGQGLGRAYAQALAEAGAAVIVNDLSPESAADAVDEIVRAGGRAYAAVAAVGTAESAELLVETAVSQFGRLDIMVANAGVLRDRVLWKMSDDDFDVVVATHLRGTFTCGRAAARHLREQGEGGRIIVVGSPAGQYGSFGQSSYSAVKAGVVAMARTWSLELARDRITANAIIPTAMTAMTGTMPIYREAYEAFERGEPLSWDIRHNHALGSPADVAGLVVWLSSEESSSVTGQAIGAGGDKLTLYSHPSEEAVEYRDGGWTAEAIAAIWPERFTAHQQGSGPKIPPIGVNA